MNASEEQYKPEHSDWSDAALDAEPVLSRRALHRIGWVLVALLIVVLLVVLPPLVNVSHYQRRIAQAISASIGRPVHFDAVQLHLLPLPGLTIQNFVVEEDPAFGSEPALRANTVEARLRLASLWRRRIEVSHITLQAPSINLVRRADGRWSLQGVITEAGHLQDAPTAQGRASAAPRFPYIEATDARINIKAGETKLPWSLLDARLALWLPDANEWRVRLRGRPLRTDTDVSDVGELEMEGSLGRGSGRVLDQPLAISAHWASTPLGEAAKLVLGSDTDFRGAASGELEVRGTPSHMQLSSDLHLHNLRRAEFVPRLPMSVDAHCQAEATGVVAALQHVRCAIPTEHTAGLLQGVFRSREDALPSAPNILLLQAEVPDLLQPGSARVSLDLKDAEPAYVLNWARVLSSRIPETATASGNVRLHASWNDVGSPQYWSGDAVCLCTFTPPYQEGASTPGAAPAPDASGNASAATEPQQGIAPGANQPWSIHLARKPVQTGPDSMQSGSTDVVLTAGRTLAAPETSGEPSRESERFDPTTLVQGEITHSGVTVRYPSPRLAEYAASLFPPLGDNLPQQDKATGGDSGPLQSVRTWGQAQTWSTSAVPPATPKPRRRSRR